MNKITYPKTEKRNYKNNIVLIVIALSISASILVVVPALMDIIVVAGNHVIPYPGKDLETDYVLGVIWAVFLGFGIFFWPVSSRDKRSLLLIWLVKAFVALVIMLAYEYQYALDPDGYFTNALSTDFAWGDFMFGNGTRTTQQVAWLHLKIVPGSYHAAKIGFAHIGFVGVYLFYRAAVVFLHREDIRIFYVLALFPGILFWSSILGKDPITLFAISLYVYGIVAWQRLNKPRYFITVAFGILIASSIRIWLASILIVPLLIFVIINRRSFIWRAVIMVIGVMMLFIVITKLQSMWNISTSEELFEFQSYAAGAFEGGGSSEKPVVISGFKDIIIFLPYSLFTALFRPLPFEVRNLFGSIQGLENIILLLLLFTAAKRTRWKELKDPMVCWAILLILTWATIYGLVTTNLGALVRYKLQILPILLGLLLYLSRRREGRLLTTLLKIE